MTSNYILGKSRITIKNKLTGIVIDDEKDLVDTITEYFTMRGHNIVGRGYNGYEAVTVYSEKKPDYVILDMKMPQYDGMYAITNIQKINPEAKIFVITGYSDYDKTEMNVTKIISKPFRLNELIKIIEDVF
jgi:YesN/AraC family two-component response regulator